MKSLNQSMKDENLMGNAGDVSDEIYDELSPAEKLDFFYLTSC